jgi:uncharacterized protein YecT (DUF1311 family)
MSKTYSLAFSWLLLVLLFTVPAAAECEHAVTNMDMIDCEGAEYKKATSVLLQQIRELRKRLYPQEQKEE